VPDAPAAPGKPVPPPSGEEVVVALLRALPQPLTERIVNRLSPPAAERVRARLAAQSGAPVPLDKALREFTDVQRIVERPKASAEPPADVPDSIAALRALESDQLLAALRDEQPPTVARVMACLEPSAAAELVKRLPAEVRPEVALRLSQTGSGNREVLACLARAVLARCRSQKDAPPEPPADDRVHRTATLLRTLARAERVEILKRIEETDPETAAKVGEQLYQFSDLLRIEDRALQSVLAELELKTLALALKRLCQNLRWHVG
jgi:flagellar motor switch protein FliG